MEQVGEVVEARERRARTPFELEFGARLKDARLALRPAVSQRDVAQRLGVSNSAVTLWETGANTPELSRIAELSRWYKVSTDYLLCIDNNPKRGMDLQDGVHLIHSAPVVPVSSLKQWNWTVAHGAIQTLVPYAPRTAAAYIVTSDSLQSVIQPGEYAVIASRVGTEPGDTVLVEIPNASEPILRRYVREGGDDLFIADDSRFPTHNLKDECRIIGKLVEIVRHKVLQDTK